MKKPIGVEIKTKVYMPLSKYGAEMEVWRGTQKGIPTVIVNPGVIIGPGFWNIGSGLLFKLAYKGQSYAANGVTAYVDCECCFGNDAIDEFIN